MNRVFNLFLLCLMLVVLAVPDAMAATTPTRQAGRLSVTSTGLTPGKQFKLQWRTGDGNGNIVVVKEASAGAFTDPTDNADYTVVDAGNLAAANPALGVGEILYVGANHELEVEGLAPGTDYTFMVYEYDSQGAGDIAYNTATRSTNPATFTAPAAALANDAQDLASEIDQHVAWIDWDITNASGGNIYLQVATDATFTTMVPGYSFLNIGNTDHWVLFGLTGGDTYYYRVAYIANGAMAPWYEAQFTCDAATAPTITFTNGDESGANLFPTTAVAQSHNGNTYAITLEFDEIMDWSFEPTITVDPDGVNGAQTTLTFLNGEWTPVDDDDTFPFETKYTAYYSVDGTSDEEFTQDAFFDVAADAQDYAGVNNVALTDVGSTQLFTIDTKAPTIANAALTDNCLTAGVAALEMTLTNVVDQGYGTVDQANITTSNTLALTDVTQTFDTWTENVAGEDYTAIIQYDIAGGDASGDYIATYTLTDDAGNITTSDLSYTIDNDAPTSVTIAETSDGCLMLGNDLVFTVTVADAGCSVLGDWAAGDVVVSGLGDLANAAAALAAPTSILLSGDDIVYTYTIRIAGGDLSGTYTIGADVTDPLGNGATSETATVEINIDNVAPAVASIAWYNDDQFSVANTSACYAENQTIYFSVVITDQNFCSEEWVEGDVVFDPGVFGDGAGAGTTINSPTFISATPVGNDITYKYSLVLGDETADAKDFTLTVTDPAGNELTSDNNGNSTFTIDDADPTFGVALAITNSVDANTCYADAATDDLEVTFTMADVGCGDISDENVAIAQTGGNTTVLGGTFVLDNSGAPAYVFDYTMDGNEETGDYDYTVTLTDDAGNTATDNVTFSIDNTAPSITSAVFKDSPVVGAGTEVSCASVGQTVYLHLTLSEVGCGTMDGALANAAGGIVINSGDFTDNLVKHANETVTNPSYVFVYETTIDAGDAAGLHTVNYDLSDSKVNTLAGQEVSITIDKTAPTIVGPTISDASSCYGTGATVTFTVTAIDPPVTCGTFDETNLSVWLERDDNQTNDGDPDRDAVFVSKSGNTYTYEYTIVAGDATDDFDIVVVATDEAGNSNTPSDGLGRGIDVVSVDRTAPVIGDVANVAGNGNSNSCLASGDQVTFEVPVSDLCSGDVTVDSVYLHIDTQDIELILNDTYTYSTVDDKIYVTYDVLGTETENVLVTVDVYLTDAAGNSASLDQDADFYFDFTAPTITALEPTGFAAGDCFKTGETVSFSIPATEDQCDDPFISLTLKDLDGDVITTGTDQVNGGFTSIAYNDGTKEFDVVYTIQGTEDQGLCTIEAVVTDAAGNVATTQTTSDLFSIDYTGPAIAGFAFSNAYYTDLSATVNDASITVTITEAGTCTFDAGNLAETLIGSTSGDLSADLTLASMTGPVAGVYTLFYTIDLSNATDTETITFDISALDDAGNISNDPASDSFIVDDSDPVVNNYTTVDDCVSGSLTFSFDVNGAVSGINTITINESSAADAVADLGNPVGGANGTYTYTLDVSGDTDGAYDLSITVLDNAGNEVTYVPADPGTEYTVDNSAPTSVTIAETSSGCLTDGDDLVFTVTIADAGCAILADWAAGDVVVDGSVTGLSNWGVAPAITQPESDIVYTYTIPIAAGDATGSYTIGADVTDPLGNGATAETSVVTTYVDNDEPVFANFVVTQSGCVSSGNISGTFELSDAGCGDVTGLTVTLDFPTAADVELTVGSGITDNGDSTYSYTYTLVGDEGDGAVDVYVDAADTKGNTATQEDNGDTDLTLDFTGPQNDDIVSADLAGDDCLKAADTFTFYVEADFTGCVTPAQAMCTISDLTGFTVNLDSYVNQAGDTYRWTYTVTVPAGTQYTGDYTFNATIDDAVHAAVTTADLTFSVDNSAPTLVDILVLDGQGIPTDCIIEGTYTVRVYLNDTGCGNTINGIKGSAPGNVELVNSNLATLNNFIFDAAAPTGGISDFAFDYDMTVVAQDANLGANRIRVYAYDMEGNTLNTLSDPLFTVDALNHTVTTTASTNAAGTCVGTGDNVVATLVVNVDETSCSTIENVKAQVELSDNSTVWMTPSAGNPVAVNGNYPDGTYTFTYTVDSEDPNGALVAVTGYINEALNAEVTDDDGALDLTLDTDAPTVTPQDFTLGCLGSVESAVFTDIVVDDAVNCTDITATNIEVELYTAGDAWTRTLTSVSAEATTFNYTQGDNTFDLTYAIQGDEPQGEAIGIRLNVTDNAGNSVEDQVVDADAFTVDYAGPVVSNIQASTTCVKETETVNVTFHVEEDGCGTFDKTNINATATIVGGGNTIGAIQANITVVAGQTSGYDVTVPFIADATDGTYNVSLAINDDEMNDATGDLGLLSAFSIDNDAPSITDLTITQAGSCLKESATISGTVTVSQTGCSLVDVVTVYLDLPGGLESVTAGAPTGDVYPFTYTIVAGDGNGDVDVYATATDELNTVSADYEQGNTDLSVDQVAPEAAALAKQTAGTCFSDTPGQDDIEVTFTVTEVENSNSCIFDETNITSANAVTLDNGGETITPTIDVADAGVDTWTVTLTYNIDGITVDGSYDITIEMSDDAGNAGTGTLSLVDAFVLDNSAASITSLVVDNCETATVDYSFTITDTDCAGDGYEDATVSVWTTDVVPAQVGIDATETTLDGDYSGSWDISGVDYVDGETYQLRVNYTDDAGNPSTEVTSNFTVDKTGPVVAGLSDDATCVKDGATVIIDFDVTESGCGTFDASNIAATATNGPTTINATNIRNSEGTWLADFVIPAESGYAEGDYLVTLDISDDAGNDATGTLTIVDAFGIDNTPPVVDNYSLNSPTTCVSGIVEFDFDVFEVGCGDYTTAIFLNGSETATPFMIMPGNVAIGAEVWTASRDISGDADGDVEVMIRVTDAAGNVTEYSPASTPDYTVDNNAPSIDNLAVTDCSNDVFNFSFDITDTDCAEDGDNDASITIKNALNNTVWTKVVTGSNGSYSDTIRVNNPTYSDGTYTLYVDYDDDSENASTQVSETFEVDKTGPVVADLADDATCVTDGETVTIDFDVTESGCGTFDATNIAATATLGGTTINATNIRNSEGTWLADFVFPTEPGTPHAEGEYTIDLTIADDNGNSATGTLSLVNAFELDNTAPVIAFTSVDANACASAGKTVEFSFTVTDADCGGAGATPVVTITLPTVPASTVNATNVTGTYPNYTATYLATANDGTGTATIDIFAADGLGNSDSLNNAGTFQIDNTNPSITNYALISVPTCYKAGQTVTFAVDYENLGCATEDIALWDAQGAPNGFEVDIYNGGDLANGTIGQPQDVNGKLQFTYLVNAADVTGAYTVEINIVDSEDMDGFILQSNAFSIDNDIPTLALVNTPPTCVEVADVVTFQIDANDVGCGTFDEDDITVTVTDGTPANISAISAVAGDGYNYEFTYTVANGDATPMISINATDDLGNTLVAPVTHTMTVDTIPLTLAVNLPQTTCVSQTIDGTFEFGITATNDGCDQAINNLTVTAQAFGEANATTLTENNGTYTYTLPTGDTYTGEAVITVTAVDGFGNTVTETANFMIDNSAPELSAYADDAECVRGMPNTVNPSLINFAITAEDLGCGTFEHGDIVVTMTSSSGLPLVGNLTTDGSTGTSFHYAYTVNQNDPTGAVNITFDLTDSKGNIATQYAPAGDEFSIDNTAPTLALTADKSCVMIGDEVTFTLDASDVGCATFDVSNISAAIAGDANAQLSSITQALDGSSQPIPDTYTFTYTVDAADSGLLTISADAADALGNMATTSTFDVTVDTIPLTLAVNLPQTTCVSQTIDGTFEFGITATNDGCDTQINNLTVTAQAFGEANATTLTENNGTYTYTLPTGDTYTGEAVITVTAVDGFGNTVTETANFMIDNSAPELSAYADDAECVSAPVLGAIGTLVHFSVNAEDLGCGTFEHGDIVVTMTSSSGLPLVGNLTTDGSTGTSFHYAYTVNQNDPTGAVNITFDLTDSKGNIATQYAPAGDEFSIDNTAPTLALTADKSCVMIGDEVTFTLDASDVGCATFDVSNISAAIAGDANAQLSSITQALDGSSQPIPDTYTFTYTVDAADSGLLTISADAADALGNMATTSTFDVTVDTIPLTLAVNLPQTTCVSQTIDGTFEFGITATNDGCDTQINNLTVTAQAFGEANATTLTENNGTYTYTLPTGDTYTGEAVITVTAVDGFGNTVTETANFMIDNSAPELSAYADDAECVRGMPNTVNPSLINFAITAEDLGCGTFEHGDIVVTMTSSSGLPLVGNLTTDGSTGTSFHYAYTVNQNDPTGAVNITFDLTDSKGNIATQYAPAGDEFSIDNTAPTLALTADKSCVMIGDEVTFTLDASDVGCATFDVSNISAAIAGDANAQLSSITQALDGSSQPIPDTYTFTYTVDAADSGLLTISADAADALGNMATTSTFDVTVDTIPLTLAVNLPQTTCVSQTIDGTFEFGITATNDGCDTQINNLTVTAQAFGEANATTLTENNGTYTYTLPTGDTYTGEAVITVTAVDGFGNTVTETANFMIDNSAPVLSAYADDAECVSAPVLGAIGTLVHFSVNAEDLGCGTFEHSNISVNMTSAIASLVNTPQLDLVNTSGNTYAFTYLVDQQDPTGAVNITFDLMDSKGNIATQYSPAGDEFSIDNTAPVLTNLNVSQDNAVEGDVLTFTFDLADAGCSLTQEPVVQLTFSDNSNTNATYVTGTGNGTYTYTYTVPSSPVEGGVNVIVTADDALNNMGILNPNNFEFVIISNTPANVTSIIVNDLLVEDSDAGNNFTVAVSYDQPMDAAQSAPVVTFDPTVGGTFTNGIGAWSNGNQTYTMTYIITDAGVCANDVDVSVTGGQNTVGIAANNGTEANLFTVYMCAAANARSDIQFAGNEANGISSLSNGVVATSTSGTRVLKLTVRDDITTDTDTKPTIITALTINAAGANQAAFNTHINAAALFSAAGAKLADATIGASTLTFSGMNVTCADNGTYDMYLRLTLANPMPAAADGKRLVFALGNTNVTTGANSTTMTTFANTSSTAATNNVIQVIGTNLVYTAQPQNTSVGTVAPTVIVELRDVNGNIDINQAANITLGVTNTTTITAGGTKALANGVATFDGLQFGYAATNLNLTANASISGVTSAVSSVFSVSSALPSQVANLVYLGRSKTSIAFTWTASSNALVLAQEGSSINVGAGPQNGLAYAADNNFTTASTLIGNAKVVYFGSNATLTVGGLTQNTTYTFIVYAFNSDQSYTPATITYNTAGAPTLTRTTSRFKDEMSSDIELRSFDVTSSDVKAFLKWETIRETDNLGFEVHRAQMTQAGLEPFEMISSFEDNSALNGLNQSEFGKNYKLTDDDATLTIGGTYVYRLVSVASDGYKQVQAEQNVLINGATSMTVSEIQPNPVVSDLAFDLDMNEARDITIQIYAIDGTLVAQPIITREYSMGLHKVKIDLDRATIPAGTYTLKVITGDNQVISKRFVVVR